MKIIDIDIVVPILVKEIKPNSIIIPKPTLISKTSSSIEVEQTFQCDVDYYGGVGIEQYGAVDAKLVKNPNTMTATLTGLMKDTEYTIKGVGLPILGNETIGEGLVVRTKASPIPNEYQLVEYIEANGLSYILLNYFPREETSIQAKMHYFASYNQYCYFGCQDGNNVRAFKGYFYDQTNYRFGNSTVSAYNPSGKDIEVYFNKTSVTTIVDCVSRSFNFSYSTAPIGQYKLALFANNNGGNITQICNNGFVYFFTIRENDEIKLNLYPVYRKADNKPGMYDVINHVFYTNQGSGEFLVGPDAEWHDE